MLWSALAGIAACTNAGYYIANKEFLRRIDPDILAAAGFLATASILLAISAARGFPALGPLFLPAVGITATLNVIATILTFRALSSTDISLAVPMISFTPVFLIGTAALILHELPSLIGMAGILIIVTGSYILNTSAEHTRLSDPFRAMTSHPGILSMLIVAFLFAIAINFDKIGVQNSDPVFSGGITALLIGLAFVPIALLRRHRNRDHVSRILAGDAAQPLVKIFPVHPKEILLAAIVTGCLLTIEAVTINTAYTEQIAPYVIAIKRMSILLVVLYGTLVFREKELVRRLAGASLMILGAVMILVFP